MFQHAILVFSESVITLAVTCLSLGILIYFTLHNWQKVAALSRNRSQLLSVGAGIVVVLLVMQLRQSRGAAGAPESGDDLRFGVYSTPVVNDVYSSARRRTPVSVDRKICRQMLFENPNQMYDVF